MVVNFLGSIFWAGGPLQFCLSHSGVDLILLDELLTSLEVKLLLSVTSRCVFSVFVIMSVRSILSVAQVASSVTIQHCFEHSSGVQLVEGSLGVTTPEGLLMTQEVMLVPHESLEANTLVVVPMELPPDGQAWTADTLGKAPLMLLSVRGNPGQAQTVFERVGSVYDDDPLSEDWTAATSVIINSVGSYLVVQGGSALLRKAEELTARQQAAKRARIEGEKSVGIRGDGGTVSGGQGKTEDGRYQAPDNDGMMHTSMSKDGLKHHPKYWVIWRLTDLARHDAISGGVNVAPFDVRRIVGELQAKVEDLARLETSDPWYSAGRLIHLRDAVVMADQTKTGRLLQFTFVRWEAAQLSLFDFLSHEERGRYYPPSATELASADFLSALVKGFENLTHALCAVFGPNFDGAFTAVVERLRDPHTVQTLRAFSRRLVWYRVETPLYVVAHEVAHKYDSTGALRGAAAWHERCRGLYSSPSLLPAGEQGMQEQRSFYDDVDPQIQFGTETRKRGGEVDGEDRPGKSRGKGKGKGGSGRSPATTTPATTSPRGPAAVTPAAPATSGPPRVRICADQVAFCLGQRPEGCTRKDKCRFAHEPLARTSYDDAKAMIMVVYKTESVKEAMLTALEAQVNAMLP